jgi:site-specific DNA-methyltransferase (adenine-specific)
VKPYYQDEVAGITIYHGDCQEVLPQIWHHADILISDPPYGINWIHGAEKIVNASKLNGIPCVGDDRPFDPAHLLNDFHHILLWGANYYADKLPIREGRWLVWDKRCGYGDRDMSDCEFAWVRGSKGVAARMVRHLWDGFNRDSERGISRVHPMQKPVVLMAWCLSFLPNGIIIDPYMGSGPTLAACKRWARHGIGIEIEEKYCEIAARRLEKERLELFEPPPEQLVLCI